MTHQEFLDSLKVGDKVAFVGRMHDANPYCDSVGTVVHITKGRRFTISTTTTGRWSVERFPETYQFSRDGRSWGDRRCWRDIVELTPELLAQYEASEVARKRELQNARICNDLRDVLWRDLPAETVEAVWALVEAAKAKEQRT